jgi:hypothetical protein
MYCYWVIENVFPGRETHIRMYKLASLEQAAAKGIDCGYKFPYQARSGSA